MAMSTEHLLHLINNDVTSPPLAGGCTEGPDKFYSLVAFGPDHLTVGLQPVPSQTSVLARSILEFIDGKLNSGHRNNNLITLKLQHERTHEQGHLHVELNEEFITRLHNTLPQSFIRVFGNIGNGELGGNLGSFDKRILLQDIHNKVDVVATVDRQSYRVLRKSLDCKFVWDRYYPTLKLTCSITVGCPSSDNVPLKSTRPIKINTDTFIRNLFENESTKDLTIVAGDGAEVKCHRIIFAAHSTVLSTMITSGMTESQTGRIEMKDNSEQGLKHLLRYLYGLEMCTDSMSCDVAVELFQTSHKYELSHLQDCLQELLLNAGVNWFTPDIILELHFYVRNVADFDPLKDHSLDIMTSMEMDELNSCDSFKKLDPDESITLLCKLVKLLQNRVTGAATTIAGVDDRANSASMGIIARNYFSGRTALCMWDRDFEDCDHSPYDDY